MKKTVLIITALLVTVVSFSQKKELRNAAKEIKSGSFEQAKSTLASIEGLISSADEDQRAEFYLYKGQAYMGAAGSNEADLLTAAEAFKKVSQIEESTDKKNYSEQAEAEVQKLVVKLVNTAIEDQNANRYSSAYKKLYAGYTISKTDTTFLYFAAVSALNAKEYDKAMSYYEELLDLGYTGIEKEFIATNKETEEIESFSSEEERKIIMLTGKYVRPKVRWSESRRPTILKDLGAIYIDQGKIDEAKKIIADARQEDPNDVSLIHAEANIALKLEDMKTYNALMQEIVELDPVNPELFYNLGVSSFSIGELEKAKEYYKKAIELDPNYTNAKVNLAVVILDSENEIIEEMNSLGTSSADNKRYEVLKNKRDGLYRNAVPYLEEALQARENDVNIMRTLMNIYSILAEDAKFKEMKSRIEAIEE